eukprot:6829113-Alexandrium_andersonii.AAC.1
MEGCPNAQTRLGLCAQRIRGFERKRMQALARTLARVPACTRAPADPRRRARVRAGARKCVRACVD